MNAPRSIDEYPIRELPDTPLWTENYAVLATDPVSGLALYYSCGRWIGDPRLWREVISVCLPGQRLLFAKNYGSTCRPDGPGASLTHWQVVEPERRFRLRFSGPVLQATHAELLEQGYPEGPKSACVLDVSFDALGTLWDMKHASNEAEHIAGAMHIEQIGKANGTVVHEGTSYAFNDAYIVRDHSRGPRDIARYRWSCWMNGHLPGNRFFHLYAIQTQGTEKIGMSNAGIFEGGSYYPAQLLHTDLQHDAVNPDQRHSFVLGCALGEFEVRTAEVISS